MKKAFRIIPFIMLLFTVQGALADDAGKHEALYGFLAGSYLAVGKSLDSEKTYHGKVVFRYEKDHLVVTRNIQGETVRGTGRIEHALGADEADVLRVRFTRSGRDYEITYLWRSDLDNYARLSGYVYRPGVHTESPGLEALFIDHTKK